MKKSFISLLGGYGVLFSLKLSIILLIVNLSSCSTEDTLSPSQVDIAVFEFKNSFDNFSTLKTGKSSKRPEEDLSESEAKDLLSDLATSSQGFLIDLGFEEDDISEFVGTTEDEELIAVSMILLEMGLKNAKEEVRYNINDAFFTNVKASVYQDSEIVSCALEAFGIATIAYIIDHGIEEAIERYGKKGLLKVLGKSVGKAVGWVGLAIALWDLKNCLDETKV